MTGTQARWILLAVILASGIVFLDSTIVNVALPTIAADLPATAVGALEGQAYVTSGYLATLSAFLIIAGALADRYGRRRIFIIGLVSFGITSALCGLAPTMEWLIVFRLLQGAAGALLVPGPLSLITANFEGEARARAFGLWSAATAALTITGPLIGGVIVDSFSWRLAFLVNVPLGAGGPVRRDPPRPGVLRPGCAPTPRLARFGGHRRRGGRHQLRADPWSGGAVDRAGRVHRPRRRASSPRSRSRS